MKKVIVFSLFATFFVAVFTACGGASSNAKPKSPSVAQNPVVIQTDEYNATQKPKDPKEALKTACEVQNSAQACFDLGLEYGSSKDYTNANVYFTKACDMGEPASCDNVAVLYYKGWGVKQDLSKELLYRQKACDMNFGKSCHLLGYDYYKNKDYAKAKSYYEKGCNKLNYSESCSSLGFLYVYGNGVKVNKPKAMEYFTKSCNLNNGIACTSLGILSYGQKDYNKARTFFEKACNLNEADGCNNLGTLYAKGEGVKQDYSQAKTIYEKACELNNGSACNDMGVLYYNGQNLYAAKQYFGKACSLGNQNGCNNYKILNEQGVR